ncbi:MAG: radical family heme chaperone HemW [Pseudomonadota bacterium]
MPPLGLYVHIPWCVRKCPYCDFNSHELKQMMPEDDYLQALSTDLAQDLQLTAGRKIETVFFGGGTPSLLQPSTIHHFLQTLRDLSDVAADAEITLEANPGTLDAEKLDGLLAAGVNRLSIGIQSFNDHHLESLGRIHKSDQAINAAVMARKAGFRNFNLDLMFGLPGQIPEEVVDDLLRATGLQPSHLSFYQLTLEPNTLFFRFPPALPDDDVLWSSQQAGFAVLEQCGFEHYEVSAWALPGMACRHNLNYWQFGDYLGVGAGAHGKLTDLDSGLILRYAKQKHPQRYMMMSGGRQRFDVYHHVSSEQLPLEFLMNHLRLRGGFSEQSFSGTTGLSFSVIRESLEECQSLGLMVQEQGAWRCTGKGWLFLDDILCHFA